MEGWEESRKQFEDESRAKGGEAINGKWLNENEFNHSSRPGWQATDDSFVRKLRHRQNLIRTDADCVLKCRSEKIVYVERSVTSFARFEIKKLQCS